MHDVAHGRAHQADESFAHTGLDDPAGDVILMTVPVGARTGGELQTKRTVKCAAIPRRERRTAEKLNGQRSVEPCNGESLQLDEMILGSVEVDCVNLAGAGGEQRQRRTSPRADDDRALSRPGMQGQQLDPGVLPHLREDEPPGTRSGKRHPLHAHEWRR